MTHTLGPWIVDDRFPDTVRSASGTVVAIFDNASQNDNARLGAAAPDMLAALHVAERQLVAVYGELSGAPLDSLAAAAAIASIRAAIAMAEGC